MRAEDMLPQPDAAAVAHAAALREALEAAQAAVEAAEAAVKAAGNALAAAGEERSKARAAYDAANFNARGVGRQHLDWLRAQQRSGAWGRWDRIVVSDGGRVGMVDGCDENHRALYLVAPWLRGEMILRGGAQVEAAGPGKWKRGNETWTEAE